MAISRKQNLSRQNRKLIYQLKRREGFAIRVIKAGDTVIDDCTGVITRNYQISNVRYAMILDKDTIRSFVYDLAFIASNRNFTSGGYFDKNTTVFYIDRRDLDFPLSEDDMNTSTYIEVEKNSHTYLCKKLQNYEDDSAYIVEAVRTTDFSIDDLDLSPSPSISPSPSPSGGP